MTTDVTAATGPDAAAGGPPALDGRMHINLTVTDLDRSVPWYRDVFGMVQVNDVTPPGSGFRFVTLLQPASFASVVLGTPLDGPAASAPPGTGPHLDGGDRFDEHRVGLHHLAYHVPARADLDRWIAHLDRLGVAHSPVTHSAHEAGAQVWFRDPDHIWLEVYWTNRDFFIGRLRQVWRESRRNSRDSGNGGSGHWLGTGG